MTTKILIVEDDPSITFTLQMALEQVFEGAHIETAENGMEALMKLGTFKPDLITSDLQMPVMNGWQLLDMIRKHDELSKIPFVVISGEAENRMPEGVPNISKPFTLSQLEEKLKEIVA